VSDEDEGVAYEDLKSALDQQRRANTPVELAAGFYEDARRYLTELREEYETAHARDPASKEVRILQDELFRAREALNDLFDARAKRILSHTLSEASELDEADLAEEERELFNDVRKQVDQARENVLEGAQRGGEHALVRITAEMPSFTGADLRIYDVAPEDVVALPEETAELLVEKGKAEAIRSVEG
jgi:DNA replication initiation complex subunit (GINS family)